MTTGNARFTGSAHGMLANAAAQAPSHPTGGGPLTAVSCPGRGSITVSAAIADRLAALLASARNTGLSLCGTGFRTYDAQVALRRQYCGTSHYDIYDKPASKCKDAHQFPHPVARPGTSMHEQGVAVDFPCSTRGSACYTWLLGNAARFGFYNLPTEPWHWSINGR
jgi:LAS superfamily LD-carboxypeptidase LdcB